MSSTYNFTMPRCSTFHNNIKTSPKSSEMRVMNFTLPKDWVQFHCKVRKTSVSLVLLYVSCRITYLHSCFELELRFQGLCRRVINRILLRYLCHFFTSLHSTPFISFHFIALVSYEQFMRKYYYYYITAVEREDSLWILDVWPFSSWFNSTHTTHNVVNNTLLLLLDMKRDTLSSIWF
jgi:hypothetical protein